MTWRKECKEKSSAIRLSPPQLRAPREPDESEGSVDSSLSEFYYSTCFQIRKQKQKTKNEL